MLSPNALRIPDHIGIYERVQHKGYNFDSLTYKDDGGQTIDHYNFGSLECYGYRAL